MSFYLFIDLFFFSGLTFLSCPHPISFLNTITLPLFFFHFLPISFPSLSPPSKVRTAVPLSTHQTSYNCPTSASVFTSSRPPPPPPSPTSPPLRLPTPFPLYPHLFLFSLPLLPSKPNKPGPSLCRPALTSFIDPPSLHSPLSDLPLLVSINFWKQKLREFCYFLVP